MPNGPGGAATDAGSGGPAGFGNTSNGISSHPFQSIAPRSGSSTPIGENGLPANATRSMFPTPTNWTAVSDDNQGSIGTVHTARPVLKVLRPAYASHQAPDTFKYSPCVPSFRSRRPVLEQGRAAQPPFRPLLPTPLPAPVPAPPATPRRIAPAVQQVTAAASPLVASPLMASASAPTPLPQSASRPVPVFKNPLDKYGSPPPASKRQKTEHTGNDSGSGSGSENNIVIKTSPTTAKRQLMSAGPGVRTGLSGGSSPMTPTQRVAQKPMAPRQRPVPSGFKQFYENNQIVFVLDDDDDDGDIAGSARSSAPPSTQVSSRWQYTAASALLSALKSLLKAILTADFGYSLL